VLKLYRAHTRRCSEKVEEFCEQICTVRSLTTDRAVIESSMLMVEILVEQLRALGAGIERVQQQLTDLFATHPDHAIFQSFPGAGKALAPRLLTVWGSDRQPFQDAANMQCFAGPARVTVRDGKSKWVQRWIRIMFRCWQDRALYDEVRYQQALKRRGSPLAAELNRLAA
jgi:hypothetical protein